MHRSGTSALTRTISLLGAQLPKNVLGANYSNETGHWEPQRLIDLHDQMLAEGGSRWDDWRIFRPADLGVERLRYYSAQIRHVLADEYDDAPFFVLKEPRICRFVLLYQRILTEMNVTPLYVISSRNPLAVGSSLAQRGGMTSAYSALLWLRHILDAERATRTFPRCFVSYEALMKDWQSAVNSIGKALKIDWPRPIRAAAEEIDGFLTPTLQHHRFDEVDLFGNTTFDTWLKNGYVALKAMEADPGDARSIAALDSLRSTVDRFISRAGSVIFPELFQRERHWWGTLVAEKKRADDEHQHAIAEGQRAEAEHHRADAEHARAEQALMERHMTESDNASLRENLQKTTTEMAQVSESLNLANQRVEAMENSTSWRVTAPLRVIKSAIG